MKVLQASGLGKRFGRRVVFRKLDMSASGGATVAITGPNGSGKSTLVRVLAGVMRPTRGTVSLTLGNTVIAPTDRPFRTGLVAPYLNVYDRFSPRENLQFITRARGMDKPGVWIDEVLEQVGLRDRADDLVTTFSSGMLQRVRFAVALVVSPDVLLLDEPGSNLDDAGREIVRGVISSSRKAGRVVVVATNDAREADLCDEGVSITDFH
ncbi:MAG: heme exporter protein A [Rhodothermales bacterium]|jgi:heme exporter protein A